MGTTGPIHGEFQIGVLIVEGLAGDRLEDLEGDFFWIAGLVPLLHHLIVHRVLNAVGDPGDIAGVILLIFDGPGTGPAELECTGQRPGLRSPISMTHRMFFNVVCIILGIVRNGDLNVHFFLVDPGIDCRLHPAVLQLLRSIAAAVLLHGGGIPGGKGIGQLHGGEAAQVAGDRFSIDQAILPAVFTVLFPHLQGQLHHHIVEAGLEGGRLPLLGGPHRDGARLEVGEGVVVIEVGVARPLGAPFRQIVQPGHFVPFVCLCIPLDLAEHLLIAACIVVGEGLLHHIDPLAAALAVVPGEDRRVFLIAAYHPDLPVSLGGGLRPPAFTAPLGGVLAGSFCRLDPHQPDLHPAVRIHRGGVDPLRPQIAVEGEGGGGTVIFFVLRIGVPPDLIGGVGGLAAPDQGQPAAAVHGITHRAVVGNAGIVVEDVVPVVALQRGVRSDCDALRQLLFGQHTVGGLVFAVVRRLPQRVDDLAAVQAVFPQAGDGELAVSILGVQAVLQHRLQGVLAGIARGHAVILPVEGEVVQQIQHLPRSQGSSDALLHIHGDGEVPEQDEVPAGLGHAVHKIGVLNILKGIVTGDGLRRLQGPGDGVVPVHIAGGLSLFLQFGGKAAFTIRGDAEDAAAFRNLGHIIRQAHILQSLLGQLHGLEGADWCSVRVHFRQGVIELGGHAVGGIAQRAAPLRATAGLVVVVRPEDRLGHLRICCRSHGPALLAGDVLPGGDSDGGRIGGRLLALVLRRADSEGDLAADSLGGPDQIAGVEGEIEDVGFAFCKQLTRGVYCKGKSVVICSERAPLQRGTIFIAQLQRSNHCFAAGNAVQVSFTCGKSQFAFGQGEAFGQFNGKGIFLFSL